jgi:GntR family transcriptional regulator
VNGVLVRVDPASPEPIYAQIAGAVRREIAAGRVRPGERLPGARELAAALGINLHTVLRGYQELRDEGVVELRRGRGAVVTDAAPRIAGPLLSLRAFVTEARRAGLTATEAAAMVREEMS